MHRDQHRAQSNLRGAAPLLRITLATAVAVLMGTTLGACNREGTTDTATTTTAGTQPGERRGDEPGELGRTGEMGRAGEVQVQPAPSQQPTTTGTATERQDVMATRGQQACPMMIESTTVDVEETADGIALRFTTTDSGKVDDLRNRVEHMSRMYGMHEAHGTMMWQHMGHRRAERDQPSAGKGPTGTMPAATARVENIDNGARLILTPTDSAQLAGLREHARHHQQRMNTGECWMTQEMGAEGQTAEPGAAERPADRPGA